MRRWWGYCDGQRGWVWVCCVLVVGQCDDDGMSGKHEVGRAFEHRAEIQFHATAFYVKTTRQLVRTLKPTRRGHVSPHGHPQYTTPSVSSANTASHGRQPTSREAHFRCPPSPLRSFCPTTCAPPVSPFLGYEV
jgi:hypothetical protein